jgi:phosphoglycolate phosphatase-like HAD superfamily hydrolase
VREGAARLVLFDIDGTLLWTDGAGRRAMEAALTAVFGSPGARSYHFDGKTDLQIVRELMRAEGHDDDRIEEGMAVVLERYLAHLDDELAASLASRTARVMAGVPELLDALASRADCVIGLLTGNLELGATRKLRSVGIDVARFSVCAYGSDHESREELPGIAQRRARERFGVEFHGEAVVIVGDTPADIACGRRLGARAIAVATGRFDVEELRRHGPAAVFPDLRDTAAVLEAILRA